MSNVYAQHGTPCLTCGPTVPTHTDPSTYRGAIIPYYYSNSTPLYYADGNVRAWLFSNNGPSYYVAFLELSANTGQGFNQNLTTLNGGAYNDEARSAIFSGQVGGRTFKFFDSPSGSTSDDWTQVTFLKDIPANNSYYLWTFEANYEDDYVWVTYHHVNGLDGKVSNVQLQ